MVKNASMAIKGHNYHGPTFGWSSVFVVKSYCTNCSSSTHCNCKSTRIISIESEYDICIRNGPNNTYELEENVGNSYECPKVYVNDKQKISANLAGSEKQRLVIEVEVYQIH